MFHWAGDPFQWAAIQDDRVHRGASFQDRFAMFLECSVEKICVVEGEEALQLRPVVEPKFGLVDEGQEVFQANVVVHCAQALVGEFFASARLYHEEQCFLGFLKQIFSRDGVFHGFSLTEIKPLRIELLLKGLSGKGTKLRRSFQRSEFSVDEGEASGMEDSP